MSLWVYFGVPAACFIGMTMLILTAVLRIAAMDDRRHEQGDELEEAWAWPAWEPSDAADAPGPRLDIVTNYGRQLHQLNDEEMAA